MGLLWLMAGFAAGYFAHAVVQAVAARREIQRQKALGSSFCSLGGHGRGPAGVLDILKSEARAQSHAQR